MASRPILAGGSAESLPKGECLIANRIEYNTSADVARRLPRLPTYSFTLLPRRPKNGDVVTVQRTRKKPILFHAVHDML